MGPDTSIGTTLAVGTRVFVYDTSTSNVIYVYGTGTYVGPATRGEDLDHRIELDSGETVWGSEVNWVIETWTGATVGCRRPVQIPSEAPQNA